MRKLLLFVFLLCLAVPVHAESKEGCEIVGQQIAVMRKMLSDKVSPPEIVNQVAQYFYMITKGEPKQNEILTVVFSILNVYFEDMMKGGEKTNKAPEELKQEWIKACLQHDKSNRIGVSVSTKIYSQ